MKIILLILALSARAGATSLISSSGIPVQPNGVVIRK